MKFKAVFFDADSTLLDFVQAEREAVHALGQFMKTTMPFEEFFEAYDVINEQIWLELEQKKITPADLKVERFRRFSASMDYQGDPAELSDFYLKALGEGSFYLEGAEELLNCLQGRIPMAMITNGLRAVQEARFDKLGFDRYFDVIQISEREGSSKPAPQMFENAASILNLPLSKEILMIGDSLTSDIAGGINAGVSTCWFNPGGWKNESPHIPDMEITSLDEIPGILLLDD